MPCPPQGTPPSVADSLAVASTPPLLLHCHVQVEYTFGYKKNDDGKVRIFLHHSSVPYCAGEAAARIPAPVTEEEVHEVQAKWCSMLGRATFGRHSCRGSLKGSVSD